MSTKPRKAAFLLFKHASAFATFAFVAACSASDARPVPQRTTAGGDVATPPSPSGLAAGLTDSTSTRADRGRVRGLETATIWLIEISDFQCPYCKQWHDQSYLALDREFVQTGKIRLAYLNHPVPSLHPNARAASEAAMCASVQGKFWEMHESLFNTQPNWAKLPDPTAAFDSLATAAGVNRAEYATCIKEHSTIPLIDADHDNTTRAGVQSTPTFFIGDKKLEGAYPLDSFRTIINQQLAKAAKPK